MSSSVSYASPHVKTSESPNAGYEKKSSSTQDTAKKVSLLRQLLYLAGMIGCSLALGFSIGNAIGNLAIGNIAAAAISGIIAIPCAYGMHHFYFKFFNSF